VIGNLTADPELRFTTAGVAVAGFTWPPPRAGLTETASSGDGEPLFLRCSIWRQPAEHVAESLRRGARVIVSGRLIQRGFRTRDGQPCTVLELDAEEVGVSLRHASATITKTDSGSGDKGQAAPRDIIEAASATTGAAAV
jgi:single-strand DNA-binding protein